MEISMGELERLEDLPEFSDVYFVPSHLTKGLILVGVSVVAGGVSFGALALSLREFKRVRVDEIEAMIKGGD